jgi:hypothetical protein
MTWLQEKLEHESSTNSWIAPHIERRSQGVKHPVYDFLFEYYSFRASRLIEWSPGAGIVLNGAAPEDFKDKKYFSSHPRGVWIDPGQIPEKRTVFLKWAISFLEQTAKNPARFGCFGLHEWAMVYKTADVRHSQARLRLAAEEIAKVVESLPLCCSHIDAYRFFTASAQPLNNFAPTRLTQVENDQPGCIHVNMDLYKFAYKLSPWIRSTILREAFFLAVSAREIDMRASPYDFSEWGFSPIKIETSEGRDEYVSLQKLISEKGKIVRSALLEELYRLQCVTSLSH